MKDIKKYLNPKSQWHPSDFPESYKIDDVIEYLENYNFTRLQPRHFDSLYEVIDYCYRQCSYEAEYPAYIISDKYYSSDNKHKYKWIRFWKGPEITRKSPIFFMKATDSGIIPDISGSTPFGLEAHGERFTNIDSFDQFINYINRYLNI